jgi:hypothetical protein
LEAEIFNIVANPTAFGDELRASLARDGLCHFPTLHPSQLSTLTSPLFPQASARSRSAGSIC